MLRRAALLAAFLIVGSACTGDQAANPPQSSSPPTSAEPVEAAPVEIPIPNPPSGVFVASTTDGEIRLDWDDSRDETVTSYRVVRAGGGITDRFDTADSEYVDSGLDDGDIFSYSVLAVGAGGESARSETVSAQVGVDTNPPSIPGRPRIFADETVAVALEWRASTDVSAVASYEVSRSTGDLTETVSVTEPVILDDVEPGLVLTYSVVAIDTEGNRSEPSRAVTILSGSSNDRVVVVVSGTPTPAGDVEAERLHRSLLEAGWSVVWFDDEAFDSNLTRPNDVVLLLGDVEGEGFDWNVFATDSPVIGLKSMFVQASGLTENAPKLDRLAQLDFFPPTGEEREVPMTTTGRPKAVVYLPEIEVFPDLEVWARPVWSDSIAVAGLVPKGGELSTEDTAPGCRAFFPGNTVSLSEQTNEAWDLLIEFVGLVGDRCA